MITLNFKLAKEDYFNFYYYSEYIAPGKKTAIVKSKVKGFLWFSLLLLVIKFSSPGQTFDSFFFFCILIIGCIFLVPLFTVNINMRNQLYAFLENPLNFNVLTQTQLVISEVGISSKDSVCESNYKWDAIIKKVENRAYYFLYTSSIQALIIPKRILASEAEKEKLSKLLAQHVSFDAEVGHLVNN